jgi:hypothetical protein
MRLYISVFLENVTGDKSVILIASLNFNMYILFLIYKTDIFRIHVGRSHFSFEKMFLSVRFAREAMQKVCVVPRRTAASQAPIPFCVFEKISVRCSAYRLFWKVRQRSRFFHGFML